MCKSFYSVLSHSENCAHCGSGLAIIILPRIGRFRRMVVRRMVAFGDWSFGEWSPSEIGRSEIGRSEIGRSENGRSENGRYVSVLFTHVSGAWVSCLMKKTEVENPVSGSLLRM
jgi:hypothetical protein